VGRFGSLAALIIALPLTPSFGAQVNGYVGIVEDYGGAPSSSWGVLVTLRQPVWGDSNNGQSNGATVCTAQFNIDVGLQGINAETKNRMFAMALTAANTNRRIGLFVDTATGPNCQVQYMAYSTEGR
jgi:hypothetical protein